MTLNIKKINRSILWFTGLPGSGKTSLSKKLHETLKKNKIRSKVIDGDNFRKKITNRNYDDSSREAIGYLKIKEAIKYYDKGYFVIVSGVAYKKKWRNDLRNFCEDRSYKEVYLKCSINECIKRNISQNKNKDLLKKKKYIYEEYKKYDLKINTDRLDFYKSYNKLLKFINDTK
jgi:adenylylsulfate kinase